MRQHTRFSEEDEFSELEAAPAKRYKPRRIHSEHEKEALHRQALEQLAEEADAGRKGFYPTFSSSRHERQWILTYLGPFYEDKVIDDVLRQIKGGKEANVYCCGANPATGVDLLAAKVYRPRAFRNLRNDALYRRGREIIGDEGKQVRGRREKLAMQKKTEFGQELRHTTWLANEFETMQRLHAAGADVPKPFARSDNVIIMEFLGEERFPAPTLNRVRLTPHAARKIFDRLIENVELMLANDCIHADLSAYNVLYWGGQAKIIDLPQAVNPYVNPEALALLTRDVERLCDYFARYGIECDGARLAHDLWNSRVLHLVSREPAT